MHIDAFTDLFHSLHPRLRAYVSRKVAAEELDDVVQETFSALWAADHPAPTTEEDVRRITALAYTIADRRATDSWRDRERRDRRILAEAGRTIDRTHPSALDEVLSGTAPEWLSELSADALEVLLRYIDGYSVTEIANELDLTPNAVSSRLKRIRERMRPVIERENRREVVEEE